MLQLIGRILVQIRTDTLKLLFLAGGLLLVWGVIAPVGTLVWWLNQSAETLGLKRQEPRRLLASGSFGVAQRANRPIDCYIVYLPGVGDFSANQLTSGEEIFLDRLEKLRPNCVTVRDVFPYSAANESLGGARVLAPFWSAIEQGKSGLKDAGVLIKIRNLWRFAISADDRYGPVYSQGIATAIIDRMNAAHPIPLARRQPLNLILIGTSGGVQVALGTVPYLNQWMNARLTVVSAGGDFDGETGFAAVDHVYHLQGQRDWVEDVSAVVFPSRWGLTVGSPFNQARQQGRFTVQSSGPHTHSGDEGYFGTAPISGTNKTYVEQTLEQVNQLPIWTVPKSISPNDR